MAQFCRVGRQGVDPGSKSVGNNMFTDVYTKELLDADATLDGISAAFDQMAQAVKPNDVFVFYLAGHGRTLDGNYHFLPVDFRYYNEDSVRKNGITKDHLQDFMSRISAQKSLVILDTCNSGSFVNVQMAGRGMENKTAIDKLIRATGRTVMASSSDNQSAVEGYKGHGVFTYTLLNALKQADKKYGNRDGITTTMEIASFINEKVPELTYEKWGFEQIPQVNLNGREFPVGLVK